MGEGSDEEGINDGEFLRSFVCKTNINSAGIESMDHLIIISGVLTVYGCMVGFYFYVPIQANELLSN